MRRWLGWACWIPLSGAAGQTVPVGSADVADATERSSGRRAHLAAEIRLLAGTRVAGPAVTLRIVRDDSASLLAEGLKAIQAVEAAPPGSVIVACLDGDRDLAVFGATFATLARSRGLAGFVVDGMMRGTAELRRIGLPVFARGVVPGSAGGHYRLAGVGVPVDCGGITISPGDLIVGDADGVAVVPKDRIADILPRAQALRAEKEALLPLIAKLKSYSKAVEVYRRRTAARSPDGG